MRAGRVCRYGGRALAVLGVVLAVLCARVVLASRAELAAGDRLRVRGDVDAAIVHYRRAAGWYAPGAPYGPSALGHLRELGLRAEVAGDLQQALAAWRGVRSGIMSSRSFFTPRIDLLEEADAHIAEAMASERPPPIDAGKSHEERRQEFRRMLQNTPRPRVGWAVLALLGFAAWVGAAVAFSTQAIDDEDRLIPARARRWGAVFALGFGLFVLGLYLA